MEKLFTIKNGFKIGLGIMLAQTTYRAIDKSLAAALKEPTQKLIAKLEARSEAREAAKETES